MTLPIKATLPIQMSDQLSMNLIAARAFGEELRGQYRCADPFPHIVIDNFLPTNLVHQILEHFPTEPNASDKIHDNQYAGHHKRQVFPLDCNGFVRNLFGFFNSAAMLQFLEGISCISGLIPDPYFKGAGFHEVSRGGRLGIHADFRINEQLYLHRRMNVLIYLNEHWEPAWGGQLELWNRLMTGKIHSIDPILNRCVIFSTDADSFHGHPDPLECPSDVTRKSIALYYYTASPRIYEDIPSHETMWQARPSDSLDIKNQTRRLRTHNYYLRDWLPPVWFRGLNRSRTGGVVLAIMSRCIQWLDALFYRRRS